MIKFDMLALVTIVLLASPSAGQAQDFSKPDIGGLQPGMTLAEILTGTIGYDETLKPSEYVRHYTYSDGVQEHKTPDFIHMIEVTRTPENTPGQQSVETISVAFGGTPDTLSAVAITRVRRDITKPVSRESLTGLMKLRYGKPLSEDGDTLVWNFGKGKADCVDINYATRTSDFNALKKDPAMKAEKCGIFLHAQIIGDPITSTHITLIDGPAIITGEKARKSWIDGLEKSALSARQ